MNETMSFEEAMEFLKTTRSTLYRWLHEGSIPATKLGRQWRFSRPELTAFRDGGNERNKVHAQLRELGLFFHSRDPRAKENPVMTAAINSDEVAQAIIWDAYEKKASDIHLQTRSDGVHLLYRVNRKLGEIRTMDQATAESIRHAWVGMSTQTDEQGAHRLFPQRFFERKGIQESDNLQLLYQSVDTLRGPRVTLRLLHMGHIRDLSSICSKSDDSERLKQWLSKPRGLILFSGKTGSGKTTTLLSCLNHLARDKGKAVFSLEDPVKVQLDGVDHIQVSGSQGPAVERAFLQLLRADPDAVAIGIQTKEAAVGALEMATLGHLVLMQIHAFSPEDAIKRFEAWVGEPIKENLIGVCYQELVPSDRGGRKAVYQLLNG
jgi:type IV pilus assembly protein PilB